MSVAVNEAEVAADRLYREVCEFLYREAALLDEGRLTDWLDCLTPQVSYRLTTPNLTMCMPRGAQQSRGETLLMDETFGSFKARVQQLTTPAFTVAENPRPLTRRFIANVMIDECTDAGPIHVCSNALVYRSRGTQMQPHIFSMSRRDVLCRVGEGLRLLRRNAQLDESVVGARNIVALW